MVEPQRESNRRRWADPAYRERSLQWQRQRRQRLGATVDLQRRRLQAIVDEWQRQGCANCGYDNIRPIDPDHRLDGSKDRHVSRLVQLCASEARIRAKLASACRAAPVATDSSSSSNDPAHGVPRSGF